jgi:hypothetical protein
MWKLRKAFWDRIAVFKFANNKPALIPVPRDEGRKINPVSFASRYPAIPIRNIRVADHVPADEVQTGRAYFYKFQVAMYTAFPATQPGLPPVDADPRRAFDEAYTAAHRKLFPPPKLPAEYEGEVDLGRVAVASPYACYTERAPEGGYQWDFRQLGNFEHHPGLRSLGLRVLFRADEGARRLEATQIECELGPVRPGDPDWPLARKLALCAATTHLSLVRHFNGVHLAAGGPLAIATRNSLPAAHPVRRLLWPHTYGTQSSNEVVTEGQMAKGGDFETSFSFTHRGMCRLFEETYTQYDVTVLDPARDAERRGVREAGFETPALSNREALFEVMRAHALRYLRAYYDSDERLRADADFRAWVEELDRLVPNGVRRLLGDETNVEGAARLLAAFINMATVEHEALGTGLWNYQLWTHVQPARVYADGRREPLDVYQRLVNANFNLNVSRTRLMHDFGYMALDQKGADAFRLFRYELEELQKKMEREPYACWKVYPRALEANINA